MDDLTGFQLAGQGPEAYEAVLAPIMAPFVDALLDAVAVAPDAALLDVACGTGFVARAAAARIGTGGRLVGADVNAGMIAVARRVAGGLAPATEWHVAPADDLPFADATFDAVVCQQGVQFFPDLAAATAEAARVTRAGGKVAATAFLPRDRSPYFAAQHRAVDELVGGAATASFDVAFSGSAERIAAAFRGAGLRDVVARDVVVDITIPDVAAFVPRHLAAIPWGLAVARAHPDDGIGRATTAILQQVAPHTDADGVLTAPFGATLVLGTR